MVVINENIVKKVFVHYRVMHKCYCNYSMQSIKYKYSDSYTKLNQLFNPIHCPHIYLETVIFTGTQEVEVPI